MGGFAAPFAILASGEFLLGVFLLSGYIKSGISFPVDLTFFLMAVTIFLYLVRLMQSQELPKPALIPLLLFVLLLGYMLFSFSIFNKLFIRNSENIPFHAADRLVLHRAFFAYS